MLTGDLKDFSLGEILQFLATTTSSGVLELRTVEAHAGVGFQGGGICLAVLDMEGVRGLAARMVRARGVEVARLHELGAAHRGGGVDLAAALATETADAGVAAHVFREHTLETLAWLTRREEAHFQYEGSTQLDEWPFDVIALDDAMDAVSAQAPAWDELSDIAGDLTRVCSPVPDTPAGDEALLTAEQWRVLSFVDGRRRLKDLIELSGIGHLETCRQLAQLTAAGLVEMVAGDAPSTLSALLEGLDALRPVAASALPPAAPGDRGEASGADAADVPLGGRGPGDRTGHHRSAPEVPRGGSDTVAAPLDGMDGPAGDANRALFHRLMGGGQAPG